jgi:hypothetical protein
LWCIAIRLHQIIILSIKMCISKDENKPKNN